MSNVNKTSIEWVFNPDGSRPGYSLNPFTGCLNHKNGLCLAGGFPCYAYRIANGRVKNYYLSNHEIATGNFQAPAGRPVEPFKDSFYPRLWLNKIEKHIAKENSPGRGIFICDMSDWCGIGIPDEWSSRLLTAIRCNPQNRYYLLTKQPQNLYKFSPFPSNAWVGQTLTAGEGDFVNLYNKLYKFKDIQASIKFISFEPLLGNIDLPNFTHYLPIALAECEIDWVIIGACTGSKIEMLSLIEKYPDLTLMPFGNKWTAQPTIANVREIVQAADRLGVKVFLKDNLKPILFMNDFPEWCRENDGVEWHTDIRQEVPEPKPKFRHDNYAASRRFERMMFPYGRGSQDTPGGLCYGIDH